MLKATAPLRLLLDSPKALAYPADLALVGVRERTSSSSYFLKGFLDCDGRSHWRWLLDDDDLVEAALPRWDANAIVVSGRLLLELMALPGGAVLCEGNRTVVVRRISLVCSS